MRVILSLFSSFLFLQCSLAMAEEATPFREKGIQALKESETDPAKIVDAARGFAKASELYAKAGDEANATEMNSFLYWCKKKMTIQDIEQFMKSGDTATVEKLNAIERLTPNAAEVQKWLDRAEKFAKDNPNEHYLIAIRFNEVASRFIGTKESVAAQERSLKEQALSMEQSKKKPAVADKTTQPAATAPDPIRQRVNTAKASYESEYETGRKSLFETLDKREASARKDGNKNAVDKVKVERAAYDSKPVPIDAFSPEHKRKVEVAWKLLSAAYETAIKEYTKLAKDADADAIVKEFELAKADRAKVVSSANFSGSWEIDKTRSENLGGAGLGGRSATQAWTVTQDARAVNVEVKIIVEGQDPRIHKWTFNFDGTETTIDVKLGQLTGKETMKAKWGGGNRTLETTTVLVGKRGDNDVNITTNDKWELADEGKTLKVNRTRDSGPNAGEHKMVFTKK